MDTKHIAPEISPGYPYKRRLYPAWQEIWTLLAESGSEYQDGKALSAQVAPKFGLAPATLQGILSRAALAGLLDAEPGQVGIKIKRGDQEIPTYRMRTHYRIRR
jgi:hypothetical protein